MRLAPNVAYDNPGTAAKPFATLRQARDAVRKINQNMTDDIVVILHGGVYTLRDDWFVHADVGRLRRWAG